MNLNETPRSVFQNVNDGSMNALQAAALCRKMMQAWEATYKAIQSQILDEIATYGKEKPAMYGCVFSTSSTGNRYDYSEDGEFSRIDGELKERKKLLDLACKSGKIIIDDATGEEVHPLPIKSYSSTTILVSIKENEFADGIVQPVYVDKLGAEQ